MEPTQDTSSSALDAARSAWGELVLQNGRLAGARHPLEAPLILIGNGPSSDIRLHAAAIRRIHCALMLTPGGAILRELEGKGGTTVNGDSTEQRYLQDSDELAFGPFRFVIRLSEEALAPREPASESSHASQPLPTSEEKRRLVELRHQANDARAALREERGRQQQEIAAEAQALNGLKQEIEQGQRANLAEKRRLLRLRLRLRQRLHRHWLGERAAMRKREEGVAADRRALEKDFERLQAERQELYRARLQQNGESELGKRQLRDAWARINEERARLAQEQSRRQTELTARLRNLETREIDLADAERLLAEERRRWEERRLQLEHEVEGLDARVRNQRRKLLVQDEELRRRGVTPVDVVAAETPIPTAALPGPASDADVGTQRRVTELDQLATELADQRLYLAEQCERFHRARKQWQQEREAAAAELEPFARHLDEREQALREREQALVAGETVGQQTRRQLAQQRRFLDTWQARLASRAAVWEGERDRLVEEIRTREEKAETQLAAVAQIRRRWQQRRVQELEQAQTLLNACEQLRGECANLREDWLRRGKAVEQERRNLAERALAAEECRLSLLRQANDSNAVEQRLRRLRDKWSSEFENASQAVVRERQQLTADWERVQEALVKLPKDLAALATRETDVARRERDYEHQDLRNRADYDGLRSELERHRAQRAIYERQLQSLTDEVERLARAMLDEGDAEPLARAA